MEIFQLQNFAQQFLTIFSTAKNLEGRGKENKFFFAPLDQDATEHITIEMARAPIDGKTVRSQHLSFQPIKESGGAS